MGNSESKRNDSANDVSDMPPMKANNAARQDSADKAYSTAHTTAEAVQEACADLQRQLADEQGKADRRYQQARTSSRNAQVSNTFWQENFQQLRKAHKELEEKYRRGLEREGLFLTRIRELEKEVTELRQKSDELRGLGEDVEKVPSNSRMANR